MGSYLFLPETVLGDCFEEVNTEFALQPLVVLQNILLQPLILNSSGSGNTLLTNTLLANTLLTNTLLASLPEPLRFVEKVPHLILHCLLLLFEVEV